MATPNLTARKFRLLIGGVDFANSVVGPVVLEPKADDYSGFRTVTSKITLARTVGLTESLDPRLNTRWQIGTQVEIDIANTAGTFVREPLMGALRIASVPRYRQWDRELDIELVCELGYWAGRTPTGDCSGINPKVGAIYHQVISNLLIASGATALHLTGGEPAEAVASVAEFAKIDNSITTYRIPLT